MLAVGYISLGLAALALFAAPLYALALALPGIGLVQIGVFLAGLSLMTLGTYIYLSATRHRGKPTRLRQDTGVRLMATGVIIAFASGFADVLGIGSHYGLQRPLFGPLQAAGVALSMLIIVVGIFLYSRK